MKSLIISQLVGYANWRILTPPIWEGLCSHQWNEAQLRALIAAMQPINFIERYQFALRGERCMTIQFLENSPAEALTQLDRDDPSTRLKILE